MTNRTTVERKSEREIVVTRTFNGPARLVFEAWTNVEVTPHSTTVTFEEQGGKTLLVMRELYPSKEALDAAGTGAADAMSETFGQLDELLATAGASVAFGA
jgi:uncharacterized protein YndB with AHSA1/START domain